MKHILRFRSRSALLLAVAASFASLSILSCAQASAPGGEKTGSLTVTVPSTASWITALEKKGLSGTASTSAPSGKALAYLSSIRISIKDSSNRTITTVTETLNSSSVGSANYVKFPALPVGSGYQVLVEGYNSAVSSSSPVVSGSRAGIEITAAGSTAATVTCLPVSPEALALETASELDLSPRGEKWFQVQLTSGVQYYATLTNGLFGMCLFAGDGSSQLCSGTSELEYAPETDGSYYLAVAAINSETGDPTNATLKVSATAPTLSEGSYASPVELAVSSSTGSNPRQLLIPSMSAATSYYTFTPTSSGVCALELASNTNIHFILAKDSSFTT